MARKKEEEEKEDLIEELNPVTEFIVNAVKKATKKRTGKKFEKPFVWSHSIVYDCPYETLEPIYFWILDFLNGFPGKVEKIVDNFTASPGSGYFADLGARATKMQEEGAKMLGNVNLVLKSIINLIYDLKEFEIRLSHYEAAKDKNKEKAEAGLLALKQIWMDNVDIKRGKGSINMLTYDLQFSTLRDAFMAAKDVKDVNNLDLNERVKRILKPRIAEFLKWKESSENEIKKRFEIEKTYLKSQVNSLKLYARWAKPYLRAAEQLRMKGTRRADIVSAFNTMLLELGIVYFGKPIDYKQEAIEETLPYRFKIKRYKLREIYPCVMVSFVFRGIPQRMGGQQQGYVHGGRVELQFRAFSLNKEEKEILQKKLDEQDLVDALEMVHGAVDESLIALKEDLDHFIEGEYEKKKKKKGEEPGLFKAIGIDFKKLFSSEKKENEKKEGKEKKELEDTIKHDSFDESLVRNIAEDAARTICWTLYKVFKKTKGWPVFEQIAQEYEASELGKPRYER